MKKVSKWILSNKSHDNSHLQSYYNHMARGVPNYQSLIILKVLDNPHESSYYYIESEKINLFPQCGPISSITYQVLFLQGICGLISHLWANDSLCRKCMINWGFSHCPWDHMHEPNPCMHISEKHTPWSQTCISRYIPFIPLSLTTYP